jgi:hypothetical protein
LTIAWRTCVLKDNAGKAIGVISIGEDITEQYYLDKYDIIKVWTGR